MRSTSLFLSCSYSLLFSIALIACLVSENKVNANELTSVDLDMDASAHPPGDIIEIAMVLYPETKNVSVEVMGFIVAGDENENQNPILARGNTDYKDDKGNYRLSSPVLKDGNKVEPFLDMHSQDKSYFNVVQGSVTIPYSALALNVGKHKIGYVVKLFVDGRLVDTAPTKLSIVEVTDNVRKKTAYTVYKFVCESREKDLPGLHWKNDKLEPVLSKEIYTVCKPVCETRTEDVKIDGEYLRHEIVTTTDHTPPMEKFVPGPKRTISFATNREVANTQGTIDDYFSDESVTSIDKMTTGSCTVSIPVNHHKVGNIEQPGSSWLFWTETPDPEKHFIIQKFNPSSGLDTLIKTIDKKDVLIYVHGYDNTFKDSILRSAQLNHDLEFSGQMIAFSWPSAGSTIVSISDHYDAGNSKVELAYKHDEEVAKSSHLFLAALIDQLLQKKENGKNGNVHVLAHSMGNRILLKAIYELNSKGKLQKNGPKLGKIILAAADIDGTTYSNIRSALMNSCDRVTYYFAPDDKALILSQLKHVDKPIGLSPVFDKDAMDTISASGLTSGFYYLGHSYVSQSKYMLTDIRLILSRGLSPRDRRPPLGPRCESQELPDCFYWTFQSVR